MRFLKNHAFRILLIMLPLFWTYAVEDYSFLKCIWVSMGGILSGLLFYYLDARDSKKIEKQTLLHIRTKQNDDRVFLSIEETIRLGSLMKHFIKQKGIIANSHNNIEGLSSYKISEELNLRLSKLN